MSIKNIHYAMLIGLLSPACLQPASAQSKVSWGDEFKMHKGSTDLTIVQADKTGIYLEESHLAVRSYFVVGYTTRRSGTLVRLDPSSMAEQYRNDFDKELRGKDYDRLFFFKDKLYLFATEYSKKENSLNLFAAELDKSTGSMKGDWQQIYTWQKQDKSEDIDYTIETNSDSSRIVLTGTYTGRGQNRYEIKMMDANLRLVGKPMTITNEFDPKTFQVERFEYTPSGNAILVGRIYDYEEGKKKKDKNLEFLNYSIRLYSPDGKMIKDIQTDIDGKYLVTSKVMQIRNELVLAAFYSNDKKKKETNGLLVERLDPATGNVLVSTKQDLSGVKASPIDPGPMPPHPPVPGFLQHKSKDAADEPEEALSGNIQFRGFYFTPDNGLLILAEKYTKVVRSSSSYTSYAGPSGGGSWSNRTYANYKSEDIYMAKISATGKIDWLHDLPKSQMEDIELSSSTTYNGAFMGSTYFDPPENRPFYSGFACVAGKGMVHLFFNDNDANENVTESGAPIRRTTTFGKSTCYEVDLDMITGKYTRKPLFTNKDIPISMPRLGLSVNDMLYLTGKADPAFGKTKLIVGRIICTD